MIITIPIPGLILAAVLADPETKSYNERKKPEASYVKKPTAGYDPWQSAAGLLAVHYGSFFLICVSAPMAWALACVCCAGLCMYYISKAGRKFAAAGQF